MPSTYEKMNLLIRRLRIKACTMEELSKLMAANPRTVFRFLKRLEQSGMGLRKAYAHDRTLKYWLESPPPPVPNKLLQQLRVMDDELSAGGNLRYRKTLRAVLAHLDPTRPQDQPLPVPLQLDPNFILDHGPLSETATSDKMVGRLLAAIEACQEMRISYLHSDAQEEETFLFWPYKVVLRVGRLYVLGVRQQTSPTRVVPLAVRRIQTVTTTGELFPRTEFDVASYYKHCFGAWAPPNRGKPVRILLTALEPWAVTLLTESHFDPPARMRKSGVQATVELRLFLNPDLENWLLGLAPAVRVLEPADLAAKLAQRQRTALKAKGHI